MTNKIGLYKYISECTLSPFLFPVKFKRLFKLLGYKNYSSALNDVKSYKILHSVDYVKNARRRITHLTLNSALHWILCDYIIKQEEDDEFLIILNNLVQSHAVQSPDITRRIIGNNNIN